MKKLIVAIAIVALSWNASAQSNYEKVMLTKIQNIEIPKPAEQYLSLSNDFVRIGEKEKTQWQPYYYAAYQLVQKGRMEMSKDTSNLDKIGAEVEKLLLKAEKISPNNAEIFIIRKMNEGMMMMVDPMTRWQSNGMKATEALKKAKELDPNNPRVSILEGEDFYYTPVQFGGDKAKAKEAFTKALEQLKTYKTKSAVDPNWGEGSARYHLGLMEKK